MAGVLRFIVDKVGGIGATIGGFLGYLYWSENATLDCSGFGASAQCEPFALKFWGGLWDRTPFVAMTTFVGAVLWVCGSWIYRSFDSQSTG
jgi:hypothetical protein